MRGKKAKAIRRFWRQEAQGRTVKDRGAIVFNPKGGGADFILVHHAAWITVGNKSIWIRRAGHGVHVAIFHKGKEAAEGPISTAAAPCR